MPAPDLRIPESVGRALRWLANLSDEDFAKLEGFVQQQYGARPFNRMLQDFAEDLEAGSGRRGDRAADALASLAQVARQGEYSPGDMRETILNEEDLPVEADLRVVLAHRVAVVLTWPGLLEHERALDLLSASQNLLWSSRVLSDLRLIFPSDEDERPDAGVVLHTLELAYWDGSGMGTFYVTMDRDKIHDLVKTLQWALKKDHHMDDVMRDASLKRVGPESGETP